MLMVMSEKSPAGSYATPAEKSPYDFINTNEQPPKKSILPGNTSFRGKLIILIGGAVALMAVVAIVIGAFMQGGGKTNEQMLEIAKQQNELVRIADIGTKKARSASAQNLAITTKSTIGSDQRATVAYLEGQNIKVTIKELALGKNSKTDQLLVLAEQSNQFDEKFEMTLKEQLTDYRADVKKAYDEASGKKPKAILADNYNHVSALLAD
jgi:hypothetical protein